MYKWNSHYINASYCLPLISKASDELKQVFADCREKDYRVVKVGIDIGQYRVTSSRPSGVLLLVTIWSTTQNNLSVKHKYMLCNTMWDSVWFWRRTVSSYSSTTLRNLLRWSQTEAWVNFSFCPHPEDLSIQTACCLPYKGIIGSCIKDNAFLMFWGALYAQRIRVLQRQNPQASQMGRWPKEPVGLFVETWQINVVHLLSSWVIVCWVPAVFEGNARGPHAIQILTDSCATVIPRTTCRRFHKELGLVLSRVRTSNSS